MDDQSNNDPIVLYIVVRSELNMSAGKIGAQIGHVMQYLFMRYFKAIVFDSSKKYHDLHLISEAEIAHAKILTQWASNSASTKIVLGADNKEWASLKEEFGKELFVVKDAGHTQVEPGSETAMCRWPHLKSETPRSIKRLSLLK